MTLPTSGPISMAQIAAELGIAAAGINLNMASVRTLGGGATNLNAFHGKSNYGPIVVTCNSVSAFKATPGTGTASVVANPSATGGSGGYTYATTYVSGESFNTNNLASNTPYFSKSAMGADTSYNGRYRVTVTDSGGRTGYTEFFVTLGGYQN
jgi:hypothetical protein